jgi:chemotaxis response regulator CheB
MTAAATRKTSRIVLASSDPVFAVLCQDALEASGQEVIASVTPSELLEAARQAPDLIVLDADGHDVATLRALATKAMLVSEARIVLVSAYLAPGSAGLSALLQAIAGTFVQKPQGGSSLGLADDDGPPFAAALLAAPGALDSLGLAETPGDVDDAWSGP